MRNRYKLPLHIKNYVKKELYDYRKNKNKLEEIQSTSISTRTILIATQRLEQIEKVYNELSKEDKKMVEKIFFEKCNQVYMETNYYITKDMYYNTMNKMLYLLATEFDLI